METTFNISDLMDGLGDDTLALYDAHITTPARILALARERDGRRSRTNKSRRIGRILLIAAVLAALMTVTAYAVYELVIDRYIIVYPTSPEAGLPALPAGETPTPRPVSRSHISLVGDQDSPEYKAYTEWETWRAAHRFDWQAAGVDDSWYETPDNYAEFYSAYTWEQAEGLDAIMEKYGLTPHTHRSTYRNAEELYDALGTEPFYGGVIIPGSLSGYLYEDGSFKTEADAVFADGRRMSVTGFTNAKGSFADISGFMDLRDCREWSYETASGLTVDLVLNARQGEIMAETDGAYINLGLGCGAGVTEDDLARFADSVDFAVLAARFDGRVRPETAETVAALEKRDEEQDRALSGTADAGPDPEQDTRTERQILEELGAFGMDALPEGYAPDPDAAFACRCEAQESYWGFWSDGQAYDLGSRHYSSAQGNGTLDLAWFRFCADGSEAGSPTAAAFARAKDQYISAVYPLIDVNGCEGFALADEFEARAMWLDTERDVLFELIGYGTPFDAEYMAGLARTVREMPQAK